MRTLGNVVVVAALAVSTAAGAAASSHLSDVQYMEAARCRALIAAPALGRGDTTSIDVLLRSQGASRIDYIRDRADEMQREATRAASNPSPERKASLMAERDGECLAFSGGSPATAAAGTSGSVSAN